MLPAFGLAGSYSAGGFKTKAEALHFAIVFTATSTEGGNEPNYDKAKTLFDFITSNVQLPDVDYSQAQVDELFETTNKMLLALASKLRKEENTTELPTPPNPEDNPEDNPDKVYQEEIFEKYRLAKEQYHAIENYLEDNQKKGWENPEIKAEIKIPTYEKPISFSYSSARELLKRAIKFKEQEAQKYLDATHTLIGGDIIDPYGASTL